MTLGELIRERRKALKLSQSELGELVGQSQTTVSGWERGDTASMRNPEKLADVLGVDVANIVDLMADAAIELDKTKRLSPYISSRRANIAEFLPNPPNFSPNQVVSSPNIKAINNSIPSGERDIPVLGRAQGGPDGKFTFNGEILGWELRPPMLEGVREAFAVYVDGESMFPRYKPGETVWVNPNKPARQGDDVVVQIYPHEDGESPSGFIKEFKGWQGNDLVLQQYNPMQEIKVPRKTVKTVHTIVFAQRS